MMILYYGTAILMAIFVSWFTILYAKFALKRPKGRKRDLLLMVHPLFTVLFVVVSSVLLRNVFIGLRGLVDFNIFMLIWILPYGVTVLLLVKRYQHNKSNLS
jgi:hypothetical protein